MQWIFFDSPACCVFCLLSRTCCRLPSAAGLDQNSKAVHSWLILWLACAFEHGTPMFVGHPRKQARLHQ